MPPRKRAKRVGGAKTAPPSSPKGPKVRRRIKSLTITGELKAVVDAFNDGKGANNRIIRLGNDERAFYGRISTGILSLDLALGGGFKSSRGSLIYGEKSTGKSTVALLTIVSLLRDNPDQVAAYIDLEGTFDPDYAKRLGVDLSRFVLIEPESGEEAVDLAAAIFSTKEVGIVVTDSIAMLTPMKEIDESAEKSFPGIHARLTGNYLRRLNNAMLRERHRDHYALVLHINQFRMRIGVMFGDPRTLPGGKALEFCTSQQVITYNKEHQKDGIVMFNEHEFKITKDKTGGRLKEGKFKLIRDTESTGLPEGYIDQARTIINFGTRVGIVVGRYELEPYGKFKSADALSLFFAENREAELEVCGRIIREYQKKWGIRA